jgi:hypothetical protein
MRGPVLLGGTEGPKGVKEVIAAEETAPSPVRQGWTWFLGFLIFDG